MSSVKEETLTKKIKIIELIDNFCVDHLNEEYKDLCNKLVEKMSRKRPAPFLTGKLDIWAAATIYAIGSINFLFDKASEPYVTQSDICNYFKTVKSTTSQKATKIKNICKLDYFDTNFSLKRVSESSPYNNLTMENGFITFKQ